jgi:hypothetical protein
MRLQAIILLILLTILAGMAVCGEKTRPTPLATATPDPAEITLVPYNSGEMGFTGVMPVGWVEFSPGHFMNLAAAQMKSGSIMGRRRLTDNDAYDGLPTWRPWRTR